MGKEQLYSSHTLSKVIRDTELAARKIRKEHDAEQRISNKM